MNSKRMAKNKHRHKKANAAAATEKKKAGGRKIFSTVFQPEASSGLSLKSADKHLILEALDELYALRSAREGGTAGDAPAEGQGDTSRSKKKPKPRKKARKGVMKIIKAELVEDRKKGMLDKKNEERSKRVPSGANVRIRVGNLINSEVKMSSVKRTDNLKEIFKIAKATFKSKKCKIKKPTRAFLKISVSGNSSNYEELLRSDALCNEDCVVVSEGDAPDGFEAGSKESPSVKGGSASDVSESAASAGSAGVSRTERLRQSYRKTFNPNNNRRNRSSPYQESQYLTERSRSVAQVDSFRQMQHHRSNLPAAKFKEAFLEQLEKSQVIVVSGETGCGKTTQIPQFILENEVGKENGGQCNIVCTQPRRLSAIGVAERVASERGEKVGDVVGYQIRLETRVSHHTRIEFCTMGIFLRRLASDPLATGVSHIIIDEVHERETLSDFSLVILKDILSKRSDLKLVLMSATLNANLFSDYFNGCPTMHIPGRTFEVEKFGLEDILHKIKYRPLPQQMKNPNHQVHQFHLARRKPMTDAEKQKAAEKERAVKAYMNNYPQHIQQMVQRLDDVAINYDLIEKLVLHICNEVPRDEENPYGSILIFMPGIGEINRLCNLLEERVAKAGCRILPLHGSLTVPQQRIVFKHFQGVRKVICTTNIAETSITIDDVAFVIDTGRVKEIQYNESSQCQALVETWVSHANAMQRLGRAGRVRRGVCFQLFSFATWEQIMLPYQIPEIQRSSLEHVVLQIRLLQLGVPSEFLMKTIDPPRDSLVNVSVNKLQEIKALDQQQELTPLGLHLANLPVDAGLGKMLVYGTILGCIEPVLTIAAGLSTKSPFLNPLNCREKARDAKLGFSKADSDLLSIVNAYNQWFGIKHNKDRRKFCRDNFLSQTTLEMMKHLRRQFRNLLIGAGFLRKRDKARAGLDEDEPMTLWESGAELSPCNHNGKNLAVIRSVLVAGLYPNVISVQKSQKKNARYGYEFYSRSEKVCIHPSSVNYKCVFGKKRWMVYHQKQRTSELYVYDSSVVSSRALLLFGGPMNYNFDSMLITVGDKGISFKTSAETWKIMALLREEMDIVLEQRLDNPNSDSFKRSEDKVMSIILKLLASENSHGEDGYFITPDANLSGPSSSNSGGGFKYVQRSKKKGKKKEMSDLDFDRI
jgi:HrpA-like RNA helicase